MNFIRILRDGFGKMIPIRWHCKKFYFFRVFGEIQNDEFGDFYITSKIDFSRIINLKKTDIKTNPLFEMGFSNFMM
jgi:hypothetical protein